MTLEEFNQRLRDAGITIEYSENAYEVYIFNGSVKEWEKNQDTLPPYKLFYHHHTIAPYPIADILEAELPKILASGTDRFIWRSWSGERARFSYVYNATNGQEMPQTPLRSTKQYKQEGSE